MATADITFTQYQTELGAAKTALESGNYPEAALQVGLAQVTLSGLLASQSVDGRSFQINQHSIDELRKSIEYAKSNNRSRPSIFARGRVTGAGRW